LSSFLFIIIILFYNYADKICYCILSGAGPNGVGGWFGWDFGIARFDGLCSLFG